MLRLLAFSRNETRTKRWQAIAQAVLVVTVVVMGGYLIIRDAKMWNATLNVRLPTRAPVERVARSETPHGALLDVVHAGDLIYAIERTDAWLFVSSERSGRTGWMPQAAFTNLENWPGLVAQHHVKDSSPITVQRLLNATPDPPDAISARSFSFVARAWQCRVAAEGAGECREGKNTWRFRLPVDGGRIDSLYVSLDDPLVFAYSLTDEESSWAKLAGITPHARRPAWTTQIGGLNLAVPVASSDSVIVAALAFVASVNRTTGDVQWRHDYVYDGSGRTTIDLATENDVVRVTATKNWGAKDTATVCYDFVTGVVVACPNRSTTQ